MIEPHELYHLAGCSAYELAADYNREEQERREEAARAPERVNLDDPQADE